jgi:hypothetical protein
MPDDPFITEMDPVQKFWMYHNWVGDQNDNAELAKNHAYLLGSFSNPEAVKQMMSEGNTFESSEEDFEESSRMVREANLKMVETPISTKKRKRRKLLKE